MKRPLFLIPLRVTLLLLPGLLVAAEPLPLDALQPVGKVDKEAAGNDDEEKPEKEEKDPPLAKAKKDLIEKFDEIRQASERIQGLFSLFQDQRDGTVYLGIRPNQLDREYIYFSQTLDGVPVAGHFRGRFGQERIFTIRRHFDRIEFVARNHSYYFDPENALSRAAEANISPAVLASAKIVATNKSERILLVKADDIFLKEFFRQVKPSSSGDDKSKRFKLGELDGDRSRFQELRNYPANTDLVVDYVYRNLSPDYSVEIDEDVTDRRFVTIRIHHTLIEMPENDYQPRYDDPRVGYFMTKVTDLTSTSNVPYRDLIHRWNLQPKNPEAKISEPIEPITWWIENTTPVELRKTIREAALLWNEAYRSAGWKNAVVIKQQPDDADWDAGDIRYNVLRWTSSPNPPFGGYGPSFVNPRTGQILGADIMLEWVFLSNRVRYRKLFSEAADHPLLPGKLKCCALHDRLHANTVFGRNAVRLTTGSKFEEDRILKEGLHYLILHEIGHTLGLAHNFKSSQLHTLEQLQDEERTGKLGVTASVMDYPTINLAPEGGKQAHYYTTRPGPYDHWVINYGYSRSLPNAEAEAKRLEKILARSTEPELMFANDSDDMRSPGKAIDPRGMLNDMSSDAISYAIGRLEQVNTLMDNLLEKAPEEGGSFQVVKDHHRSLVHQYRDQIEVLSRYVGGVYVDRALVGQKGGTQPLTPVAPKDQKRALAAIEKYAFGPEAFQHRPDLYQHMQIQRRGWELESEGEDPKLLDLYSTIQQDALRHLIHENTVTRILNSEMYGNGYRLPTVFADLSEAILRVDGELESDPYPVRQALQASWIDRLLSISGVEGSSSYPAAAQTVAFLELEKFQKAASADEVGPAMRRLKLKVDQALAVE